MKIRWYTKVYLFDTRANEGYIAYGMAWRIRRTIARLERAHGGPLPLDYDVTPEGADFID